ncbi:MAG: glycosyltransferase [bacterium]
MKHHLLWVTQHYPPVSGGMAVSCQRQVEGARRMGVCCDTIFFLSGSHTITCDEKPRDNGMDIIIHYPCHIGNAAQTAWHYIMERSCRYPYSLIIGFGANSTGLMASTFALWLNVKSLVMVRGNDFDRDWFDPKYHPTVSQALALAGMIGAVSQDKIRKLKALFPQKEVVWTPNSVDVSQFELLAGERKICDDLKSRLSPQGERVVGLFGELKYKKRVSFWLRAVRDAGLLNKVSLLIVGKTDDETNQILNDPSLSPKCIRISFVERDLLPAYYAACDFMVIPSLFDGFPNVLLEAMASGCIPIVSGVDGMKDIIDHQETGFVFPPEDRKKAAFVTHEAVSLNSRELAVMKNRVKGYVGENFSLARELQCLGLENESDPQ